MKLAEWIAQTGITKTVFAKAIDLSKSYTTELCKGEKWPSADIAQRIETVTSGEVRPQDFYGEPEPRYHPWIKLLDRQSENNAL